MYQCTYIPYILAFTSKLLTTIRFSLAFKQKTKHLCFEFLKFITSDLNHGGNQSERENSFGPKKRGKIAKLSQEIANVG